MKSLIFSLAFMLVSASSFANNAVESNEFKTLNNSKPNIECLVLNNNLADDEGCWHYFTWYDSEGNVIAEVEWYSEDCGDNDMEITITAEK